MSTWISRGAPLLLTLAFSACVAGLAPTGSATRAVAVAGGAVTVTGPAGYCIDRTASRDGPGGAFVLFGTCAAISGSAAAGQPAKPAVLTASVAPGAADAATVVASFPAMARFFRSDPGRAALSRTGKASTIDIGEVSSAAEVLYLHLTDSADTSGQAVDPDYWRAIMVLGGRMVTLSTMSLSDRPLTAAEKRQVLDAFVARMKAANAAGASAG